MFLKVENVLEVWQAAEVDRIPLGTTARHLSSGRVYGGGGTLKRSDQHGEVLVCRNQFAIQLREVPVTVRRGAAGPGVFLVWCSVELGLADLVTVAAAIGPDRSPRRVYEVEKTLQEELCDLLRSLGEEHDLTTKAGQAEICNRILPEIRLAGFRVQALILRRVLTGDEYAEEKAVWATFQNGLERLLHDEEIWKAAERNRLQRALAGLEGEKIRALLTEQERTLEAERRVAKYVELFPVLRPAQADRPSQLCPHPHCRSDLSISHTFVCNRCQNTLHAFHRSAERPSWCDQCYKLVAARRRWLVGAAALVVFSATGVWAANSLLRPVPRLLEPLTLHWYGFGQRYEDNGWRQFQVQDGMVMYSGDQFRLVFSPSDDCYVYLVNLAPDGRIAQLFPNPAVNLQNPCRRNHQYEVPDGINWFMLDDKTGVETLFVLASVSPLSDLESLLGQSAGHANLAEAGQEAHRTIERIEKETDPNITAQVSQTTTRAVSIQADRRLGPPQFTPSEQTEAVSLAAQGLGGCVQRIQIPHQARR